MEIDVFWSFRSPWSYLATPRLRAMQEEWDLSVNFRPVYPIAIRTPEFVLNNHPQGGGLFRGRRAPRFPDAGTSPQVAQS